MKKKMTILNKIRQKKIILIGLTSILILGFLFNFNQLSILFRPNLNIYGKVNNQCIYKQDFNVLSNLLQNQVNNNLLNQITWKFLIKYILIDQQCNKLGLKITKNNFWEFTQFSPLLMKQYNLFNKNHFFYPKIFKKEIENIQKKSKSNSNYRILYDNWLKEKKIIEYDIKTQLYFATLLSGLFHNTKEIFFFEQEKTKYAEIEFITINYDEYNKKNNIKISDKELNQYINSHPKKINKEPSIELKYVIFQNKASLEDNAKIYKEINTYKKGGIITDEEDKFIDKVKSFKEIQHHELINYINHYSDQKCNLQYYHINKYPKFIQNWLKKAKINDIFGPYLIENSYIISKLYDIKQTDFVESRHILISYNTVSKISKRNKKQAQELAKNLFNKISNNLNNFNKFIHLSDDINTINTKGYLGWSSIDNTNINNNIKLFFQKNNQNSIGLVETELGYHIINILNKKIKYKSYCLAHLIKEKKPSEKTSKTIEHQALNFLKEVKNQGQNKFTIIANQKKYKIFHVKNITQSVVNLNTINNYNNEEILKWLFNNKRKIGDTNIFTNSNQDYIIMIINKIYPKGLPNLKIVNDEIKKIIRNKKIASFLTKKINTSKKSLDELAKEFNIKKYITIINFQNPTIINIGLEPNVAGAALGIKLNKISDAIEGESGIFVIKTNKIFNSKEQINLKELKTKITEKNYQLTKYRLLLELEEKTNIKDFRSDIKKYN